jgi:hypothetical protein
MRTLEPGDRLILSTRRDAFICATYVNTKREARIGWLPVDAVAYEMANPIGGPAANDTSAYTVTRRSSPWPARYRSSVFPVSCRCRLDAVARRCDPPMYIERLRHGPAAHLDARNPSNVNAPPPSPPRAVQFERHDLVTNARIYSIKTSHPPRLSLRQLHSLAAASRAWALAALKLRGHRAVWRDCLRNWKGAP